MIEYHCPKCYHIPIFDIQADYESIEIKCVNNHIYNYKISDFFSINPFQRIEIQCNNCTSQKINPNDLFYCIQCKSYICEEHKNQNHKNCKKIIPLEQLHCTCLEHNQQCTKLCKTCNKEICFTCFLGAHKKHELILEDSINIIKEIKYLIKNVSIEKYIMKELFSNIEYNEKVKDVYKNLMQLLDFVDKIYIKEISNQRISYIIYINIFLIHDGLSKFKSYIKPYGVEQCLKTKNKKNNFINDDSINNFLNACSEFLKEVYELGAISFYSFQNNVFVCMYDRRAGLKKRSVFLKILRNNKIENIELKEDIFFHADSKVYFKDFPKEKKYSNDNDNNNKKKLENDNNILIPFIPIFNKQMLHKKSLNNNDVILNHNNNNSHNNINQFSAYGKHMIVLYNNYILLFLNVLDFINYNRSFYDEENWQELYLFNKKNEIKELMGFKGGSASLFSIYKNIFMVSHYKHMYFYEFFENGENIQLISDIYNPQLEIINSYEFNKNCCIFLSKNHIIFYNWIKNEIIREVDFGLKNDLTYELFFPNKYTFIGCCPTDKEIFMYSLIDNRIMSDKVGIFEKHNEMLSIYNNIFVIRSYNNYNDKKFSIINITNNGINLLKKIPDVNLPNTGLFYQGGLFE